MNEVSADPRLPELLRLARLEPAAAEQVFNRLPAERRSALIQQAPAAERMRLLLLADDCAPLVRALPAASLAQIAATADDVAEVLARYASASQLAAAIDLDCRHQGRLRPGRFRRWIALLVAASEREAADAMAQLDPHLLAAGLRPHVSLAAGFGEQVRLARFCGGAPVVGLDDLDSGDEDVAAFLRLLDEAAPDVFAALGALLAEEDAEEGFNEDYAGYELRMADIGLRDYAQAAEVYGAAPTPDGTAPAASDPASDEALVEPGAVALVAGSDQDFLRRALATLVQRDDCDERLIERLGRDLAALANDIAIADGAGSDERLALAARAKADRLIAAGLRRLSGEDVERAASVLMTTDLRAVLRAGL